MENSYWRAKKKLIYSSWAGVWLWLYASGPVRLTLSPHLNRLFSLKYSSFPLWLFLLSPAQLLLLAVGKTFQFLPNWCHRESWGSLSCALPPQSAHRWEKWSGPKHSTTVNHLWYWDLPKIIKKALSTKKAIAPAVNPSLFPAPIFIRWPEIGPECLVESKPLTEWHICSSS